MDSFKQHLKFKEVSSDSALIDHYRNHCSSVVW